MTPRTDPDRPGAPHDPAAGAAFVRPRRPGRSGARTAFPGSRGGRPQPPRAPLLHFLFPAAARGLSLRHAGLGGRSGAGRLLPARCPREDAHPRLPAPRGDKPLASPRRDLTSRTARLPPHLSERCAAKPRTRCMARNAATQRQTKGSAAGGRSPRSRRFPQPARTRAPPPAPTLPIPNALEFQSYFRAPAWPATP